MLKGPNAIPKDTRIVVNIPAFRMDVFQDGTLLRSYKIGIGYQQFPLPTGFRKAEQIIFNPTWTQTIESLASDPGAVTPGGAAGNALGPIKVPIGGANLIHGGKSLGKIGTFASHGCVGLTNDEVKDFVRTLAEATRIDLTDDKIAGYLKHRTRTQVVKIPKSVPVELRYETVVIQDGQLHVYRDVYNKNTNTEENLRAAFETNGASFDKQAKQRRRRPRCRECDVAPSKETADIEAYSCRESNRGGKKSRRRGKARGSAKAGEAANSKGDRD
jgi:hypothetical protein